jgi:hypothetical protein
LSTQSLSFNESKKPASEITSIRSLGSSYPTRGGFYKVSIDVNLFFT